jgi:PadR family transcriptional regulator, regulatory protein PadR
MASSAKGLDYSNWATQVRKGLLELYLLNLLARGELYGYDLVKALVKVQGLVITKGTVCPLLSRLKKAGLLKTRLLASPSGPARKYYSLTREG